MEEPDQNKSVKMPTTSTNELWQRLTKVHHFNTTVQTGPGSKTGWTGTTTGTIELVQNEKNDQLDFIERGTLSTPEGKTLTTSNHWQWSRTAEGIHLYHRRREEPVLLAELTASAADGSFHSQSPHLCGADVYALRLEIKPDSLLLNWRITGPKKDECISTRYDSSDHSQV